jgi:hypothetical protein
MTFGWGFVRKAIIYDKLTTKEPKVMNVASRDLLSHKHNQTRASNGLR